MQDLLLAQKRYRPAYCFKHLHLELRSHDDGCRASPAAAGSTLAPGQDVVARFERQWNSLGVNKTRFFNILGSVHDAGSTVLRYSLRQRKVLGLDPARQAVKFS
jgi:biotin synthase-related radical SAM superfamily protein